MQHSDNEIKKLLEEVESLKNEIKAIREILESTDARTTHKDRVNLISGGYIVFGTLLLPLAFAVPVTVKSHIFFIILSAIIFVVGAAFLLAGLYFRYIYRKEPTLYDEIGRIGCYKIPFDKVFFKQWAIGRKIPLYKFALICEVTALLSLFFGFLLAILFFTANL